MPLTPEEQRDLGEIASIVVPQESRGGPVLRDAAGFVIFQSTHGITSVDGEFSGDIPFGD